MSTWIYTVESFPGEPGSGRHTDYAQMWGFQINLEAGCWTRLDDTYDRPYWTDFKHRGEKSTKDAELYAAHEIHTGKALGAMLVLKYGGFGVVSIVSEDHPYESKKKGEALALEEKAKQLHHRYQEGVVARFEDERKTRQLTGRGRLDPSEYERKCYRDLGLPEPGTLDAIKAEKAPAAVELKLPPEIADLVAEGLAARRARAETPKA